VNIFVINLQDRQDRRDSVDQQLTDSNTEYRFFPAISVRDNPQKYFRRKSTLRFLLDTGRFPVTTELACYASHLALWKMCLELNEPVVIMEDDFRLADEFEKTLDYAREKIQQCGFIRLEPVEERWARKEGLEPVVVEKRGCLRLIYQRMPSVRLTCYAIAPRCAAALINASGTFAYPVDHMVRRSWDHGQPIYAIEPPAIKHAEYAQTSSISGREKSILRHLIRPFSAMYRYNERRRAVQHSAEQLQD